MKIYLAADHNGFDLKHHLKQFLSAKGYDVADAGDEQLDKDDDFPEFAARAVLAIEGSEDADARGIFICGSGQGMDMAANRHRGIRAALAWNTGEARASRNDDDANVLCVSARETTHADAEAIVTVWLSTAFAAAPRFVRRLKELDKMGQ
jgi:ribose 5-phosphate isomerase B